MTSWLDAYHRTHDDYGWLLTAASWVGLQVFLSLVTLISVFYAKVLFMDAHGWRHRIAGACQLVWLIVGTTWAVMDVDADDTTTKGLHQEYYFLAYDVVLGFLGLSATLSAARDFPHKFVQNAPGQSGTLSQSAMVTQGEMLEHAFYQGLNLCQALYLHCFAVSSHVETRVLGLVFVTAPWWIRRQFPVHSFSANWAKTTKTMNEKERPGAHTTMYWIKKWQYIFYKHVVLHGLNITFCVHFLANHASTPAWRVFWLCLNTSYVMEFFLQSLVRRRVLSQRVMLALNAWLMGVSSLAAFNAVLCIVQWEICALSLALNWVHRYHDVTNTLALAGMALVWEGLRMG